jgi:hypothetical protein
MIVGSHCTNHSVNILLSSQNHDTVKLILRALSSQAVLRMESIPPAFDSLPLGESAPARWTEFGLARHEPFLAITRRILNRAGSLHFEQTAEDVVQQIWVLCFTVKMMLDVEETESERLLLLKTIVGRALRCYTRGQKIDQASSAFCAALQEIIVCHICSSRTKSFALVGLSLIFRFSVRSEKKYGFPSFSIRRRLCERQSLEKLIVLPEPQVLTVGFYLELLPPIVRSSDLRKLLSFLTYLSTSPSSSALRPSLPISEKPLSTFKRFGSTFQPTTASKSYSLSHHIGTLSQ